MTTVIFFQITLGLLSASFYAPVAGLITQIFYIKERYSGVAFSLTIIQAILGSLAPLFSVLLVQYTGDKKAPVYLLLLSAVIALIGTMNVRKLLRVYEPEVIERDAFSQREWDIAVSNH